MGARLIKNHNFEQIFFFQKSEKYMLKKVALRFVIGKLSKSTNVSSSFLNLSIKH
jgi:hypothetical protein